jgi:bifunctional non-homologous end joining protein LigD
MAAGATPDPRLDLRPMLATPATALPDDDKPGPTRWAYEMKWDGMRAIVAVRDGRVTITSRAGNDATARFPELAGLGVALAGTDAVLDGELVALDDAGVPSFERLQPRMQARSAAAVRAAAAEQPVVFMAFDVLAVAGHDTTGLPYSERRALLERLELAGPSWQTPPVAQGDGATARATAEHLGLEGVVAKRLDSVYLSGRRSDAWRKVKVHRGQELVVGGWLPGNGRLAGRLGSLLVGFHDDGARDADTLRYAGRVGSGIDERARAQLEDALRGHERGRANDASPFVGAPRLPGAVWVEPFLVVEVRFHEWTTAGVLRAPRFRGVRVDKPACEVVRET